MKLKLGDNVMFYINKKEYTVGYGHITNITTVKKLVDSEKKVKKTTYQVSWGNKPYRKKELTPTS